VDTGCYIILKIRDLDADVVNTSLESLPERISENSTFRLINLFTLGIPAYRIRFYVPLSLTPIERTFKIFRHSIYNESLQKLKDLKEVIWRVRIR
jgi:hypothetical protein